MCEWDWVNLGFALLTIVRAGGNSSGVQRYVVIGGFPDQYDPTPLNPRMKIVKATAVDAGHHPDMQRRREPASL
jgi:hypothetical protein